MANETLGQRLLSIHNLRFLIRIMEEIREALENNRFGEFKKRTLERFKEDSK